MPFAYFEIFHVIKRCRLYMSRNMNILNCCFFILSTFNVCKSKHFQNETRPNFITSVDDAKWCLKALEDVNTNKVRPRIELASSES